MQRKTLAIGVLGAIACVQIGLAAYSDPSVLTIEDVKGTPASQHKVDQLRSDYENVEIRTRTPWTKEGEQIVFRGPRILDVLARHDLDAHSSVQFIAYDNFTSEITLDEIRTFDPIFAIDRACTDADRRTGRCSRDQTFTPLAAEEQGPIFLAWPYEELPTAYVPARNSIWVWFVVAVRPVQ
ncbi:MAG: hypothetical protein KGZ68_07960 [Dechloromonas sp.]|jgi:hypothetical protein|nr:hypothetical protein [Dechloromonas sp.]